MPYMIWSKKVGTASFVSTASSITKLLLDGKNFTDTSPNSHIVTNHGSVGIATGKYGTGFDAAGAGKFLSLPAHTDWDLSDDWTIDFWVYLHTISGTQVFMSTNTAGGNNGGWSWYAENGIVKTGFNINSGAGTQRNFGAYIPSNEWVHLAMTKYDTVLYQFINGALVNTHASAAVNFTSNNNALTVCGSAGIDRSINGRMDEVRIIKGSVEWVGNFAPPTAGYHIL